MYTNSAEVQKSPFVERPTIISMTAAESVLAVGLQLLALNQ